MNGAAIGAGLNAAGGLLGGLLGRHQLRKAEGFIDRQDKQAENLYNLQRWSDPTQRSGNIMAQKNMREELARSNRYATASGAVYGSLGARAAAQQEKSAQAVSSLAGNIAAQESQRQDMLDAQRQQRKDRTAARKFELHNRRAQGIANMASGIGEAAGGLAQSLEAPSALEKAKLDAAKRIEIWEKEHPDEKPANPWGLSPFV